MLFAVVLAIVATACDGDEAELATFNGSGRVAAVEPDARPAEEPAGSNISGALIVAEGSITGLEDCAAADDGFRVFVDDNTSFTPADASDDLDSLRGETVLVSGRVSKEEDVCTPVADSVAAEGADEADGSPAVGGTGTGADGTDDDTDGTSSPGATASPRVTDDTGSITDPDETPNPAP